MNATGSAAVPGPEIAQPTTAPPARPWLKSYPPAVPPKIDEAHIGTLVDFFRHAVTAYAERPALDSFGKRMTYAELGRAAACVTSWLQSAGSARAIASPSCCRT